MGRVIAFFNLGCHGLTVFGMAVRICQRHGHGEDAKPWHPILILKKAMALDEWGQPLINGHDHVPLSTVRHTLLICIDNCSRRPHSRDGPNSLLSVGNRFALLPCVVFCRGDRGFSATGPRTHQYANMGHAGRRPTIDRHKSLHQVLFRRVGWKRP